MNFWLLNQKQFIPVRERTFHYHRKRLTHTVANIRKIGFRPLVLNHETKRRARCLAKFLNSKSGEQAGVLTILVKFFVQFLQGALITLLDKPRKSNRDVITFRSKFRNGFIISSPG